MRSIPLFKVYSSPLICENLKEVFESGYIGQGKKNDQFEITLKEYLNVEFLAATNSGTSAEHLALHILKSTPPGNSKRLQMFQGDEVLATPLTCTASNWPILANGFNIKWVDIDQSTLNMNLEDLERKITEKTKAIMLVHWGGYPVDLDKLDQILDRAEAIFGFRVTVIEDCAHAFGSTYKNKLIGSSSNICTFSFQAIKHLTCGDGGALKTSNYYDYKKSKLLRWYGIDRDESRTDFRCEANIEEWGFKFHMNDISATIGLSNFKHVVSHIVPRHKHNGAYYNKNLKEIPGLKLLDSEFDSSYWIYTVKVSNRDSFIAKMSSKGIMCSRVHERNDKHSCAQHYKTLLPSLDIISKEMICIPVGWWVTDQDLEYIVKSIKEGW